MWDARSTRLPCIRASTAVSRRWPTRADGAKHVASIALTSSRFARSVTSVSTCHHGVDNLGVGEREFRVGGRELWLRGRRVRKEIARRSCESSPFHLPPQPRRRLPAHPQLLRRLLVLDLDRSRGEDGRRERGHWHPANARGEYRHGDRGYTGGGGGVGEGVGETRLAAACCRRGGVCARGVGR